jgi:tRNA (guanine10-N2)-dimethyltransferase
MKQVFLLSKENICLAKEEVIALTNPERFELIDNLLILETNKKDLHYRLAYTKKTYRFLFSSKQRDLIRSISDFPWQSIYRKDFCVRIHNNTSLHEKDIASYIWNSVKNPRVNLTNPSTLIEFFFTKKRCVCGVLLHTLKHDFERRKPHLRPSLHPTSLHPKLARCLVNLLGVQRGTITDPFCGSGGILIEAGLIGLKPVGYDVEQDMLNMAKANLDHYKIKDYKLMRRDATKITTRISYLVTDLPYGLNTKKQDLKKLYLSFLKNLEKILVKRAVVVFPNFINYKSLLKEVCLKIRAEFTYYIHKSLSKRIVVLEPKWKSLP